MGKAEKAKDPKEWKSEKPALNERDSSCGPSVNDFISKTKTRQKQGLKPSGPELIAYARYLGIDPVVDHDLLWIVEEALAAPLPSEWTEHFDSSDRVFYYNATTHVSSWTHPLEHLYRETYKTIVHFRGASLSPQERVDGAHGRPGPPLLLQPCEGQELLDGPTPGEVPHLVSEDEDDPDLVPTGRGESYGHEAAGRAAS